jgi:hypothetical protein
MMEQTYFGILHSQTVTTDKEGKKLTFYYLNVDGKDYMLAGLRNMAHVIGMFENKRVKLVGMPGYQQDIHVKAIYAA